MIWRSRQGLTIGAAVGAALIVTVTMARDGEMAPDSAATVARGRAAAGRSVALTDLRLELLSRNRPELAAPERDPFRFQARPAPAAPPSAARPAAPPAPPVAVRPAVPTGPPPPPPIPLKFIGTMEQGKKKVAIFSDGRGLPLYAAEGELILGQYRVVRIQIESVVMEYADGKGRQTIPMRG